MSTWEFIPERGGYRIRSADGFVTEGTSDYPMVRLSPDLHSGPHGLSDDDAGTIWTVNSIPDSDAVEIIGASGRALEVDWLTLTGGWLRTGIRTGTSNQEWHVSMPTALTAPPLASRAHVRGEQRGRKIAELDMATVDDSPTVEWFRDGDRYLYRLNVRASNVRQILFNRGAPGDPTKFDGITVAAPAGWEGMQGKLRMIPHWYSEVLLQTR
jgi:hypothetical protein